MAQENLIFYVSIAQHTIDLQLCLNRHFSY